MNDVLKFTSLTIERERFGTDKGKLTGKLRIEGRKGEVALILTSPLLEKLLEASKTALIEAVEETANEFIFDITTAIPDALLLKD